MVMVRPNRTPEDGVKCFNFEGLHQYDLLYTTILLTHTASSYKMVVFSTANNTGLDFPVVVHGTCSEHKVGVGWFPRLLTV